MCCSGDSQNYERRSLRWLSRSVILQFLSWGTERNKILEVGPIIHRFKNHDSCNASKCWESGSAASTNFLTPLLPANCLNKKHPHFIPPLPLPSKQQPPTKKLPIRFSMHPPPLSCLFPQKYLIFCSSYFWWPSSVNSTINSKVQQTRYNF